MVASRYSGAGNTFVLIDNRDNSVSPAGVVDLCAEEKVDGVIFIELSPLADFRMRIFNRDGSEAEMCGNGARCVKPFLAELGHIQPSYTIEVHNRIIRLSDSPHGIAVDMAQALPLPQKAKLLVASMAIQAYYIDTGVPHLVVFSPNIDVAPVDTLGRRLRYHPDLGSRGANINFVQRLSPSTIQVRTYERGVESETRACGTGATAAALTVAVQDGITGPIEVVVASGDSLYIEFALEGDEIKNITMSGPTAPEPLLISS